MDINGQIQHRKKAGMKRYNHWFWHSRIMNCIAKKACEFDNWIWSKQYKKR